MIIFSIFLFTMYSATPKQLEVFARLSDTKPRPPAKCLPVLANEWPILSATHWSASSIIVSNTRNKRILYL